MDFVYRDNLKKTRFETNLSLGTSAQPIPYRSSQAHACCAHVLGLALTNVLYFKYDWLFLLLSFSCYYLLGSFKIMANPRLIIVDDDDTSIKYAGPWYLDRGSRNSVGNDGSPYQGTLHGVNSNASLSYAFNGEEPFFSKLINFN